MPIARSSDGEGLAVYEGSDGVVYRYTREGEVEVFAEDEEKLQHKLDRSGLWEQVMENIPTDREYFIDVSFYCGGNKQSVAQLCFGGEGEKMRDHLFVYRGVVEKGEIIQDALDRELGDRVGLSTYTFEGITDDEAFESGKDEEYIPVFSIQVGVDKKEVEMVELGDLSLQWVEVKS